MTDPSKKWKHPFTVAESSVGEKISQWEKIIIDSLSVG